MNNSILHLVENEDSEESPPLEKLANSLMHIKKIHPEVDIGINEYDNSVSILLLFKQPSKFKGYGGHEVFRIYDPNKEILQRNVADNKVFISGPTGHPNCYGLIKEFLESLGYQHFHNLYRDYISKRFNEHIKKNKIGIYSAKVL